MPFPPPRDLHHPGIKPSSLASPALAGGFSTTEPPEKPSIGDWGFFLAQLQVLMAEEHAGLFSIPRVLSSARLSSELGTGEEEKMMATKSLYCWTPVNPLSLSSGDCRE